LSRIWPRTAAIARTLLVAEDGHGRRRHAAARARGIGLEQLGLEHESNGDVLLRRLTGERDVSILKVLAGVVEPVRDISAAASSDGRRSDR
jgi:hypothetical protein